MPIVDVGCAIISASRQMDFSQKYRGKLLIAQRSPGSHLSGYWEFPGGKCFAKETLESCLKREVFEELGIEILPVCLLGSRKHRYPKRTVNLHFYFCKWISGNPVPKDCHRFEWVRPRDFHRYLFPEADASVVEELIRKEAFYFRN